MPLFRAQDDPGPNFPVLLRRIGLNAEISEHSNGSNAML